MIRRDFWTHTYGSDRVSHPLRPTRIGHGNEVTDDFAAFAKPAGWDIGADLGAWNLNFPLDPAR